MNPIVKKNSILQKAVNDISNYLKLDDEFTIDNLSDILNYDAGVISHALLVLISEGWGFKEYNSKPYRRLNHTSPVFTGRKKGQRNHYDIHEPDWEPSKYYVTKRPVNEF